MKREHLDQMLAKASRSVQLLNKHLARVCPSHADYVEPEEPKPKKRIRQDSKPLMNKLETRYYENVLRGKSEICIQGIRFRLANGLWYKPDFYIPYLCTAVEVKGPHAYRGGFENLKTAAHQYPWIKWVLVWEENGKWCEQVILP